MVRTPLHTETLKQTKRGNMYSEIAVANYGNGTPTPSHLKRSSAQRNSGRHSSSHSFVSRNSSMARSPPGLDYGLSDSSPASPISRDSSVEAGPRGRRRRISNPTLVGVNGLVSSPASTHSMDQMIWQLGTSGSDGSDESEVKKGKKRASIDSTTLGYFQEEAAPIDYPQSSGMDLIGMARGSGMNQIGEHMQRVELPA